MAIAYDNSTAQESAGTVNSLTFSHTCSGDNRILFVAAYTGQGSISGITYNGVSMTYIREFQDAYNGGTTYLYYLIAPDTGANNVIITSSSASISTIATSYTGAKQSGQPDSSAINNWQSNGTSKTFSLTTVADNSWVCLFPVVYSGDPSAGTGATRRNHVYNSYPRGVGWFDNNSAKTPAGSVSEQVTRTGTQGAWGVLVSLAPYVVVPFGTAPTLSRVRYRDALGTATQAKRYRKREILGQIDSVGAFV